jgi:hypothetical protein
MKKVIFISALAIAAAVSCTKSDIVDTKFNEQISFETYTGRDAMTKAAITDNGNIRSVGIFGYYTGEATWNNGKAEGTTATPANLMDNTNLTSTDGTTWTYSPAKYWANETDKYTFLAYAPYVSSAEGATNPVGLTIKSKAPATLTYAVSTTLAEQSDVLYAFNPKAGDATVNTLINMTKSPVSLGLKHALSRITVKAKATDATFKYDIKNITLSGKFIASADLDLATGVWTGSKSTTDVNYVIYNNTAANTNGADGLGTAWTDYATKNSADATVNNNYLMVIPVEFSDAKTTVDGKEVYTDAAMLTVQYTKYFGDTESGVNTVSFPVTYDFEQGKAYTINLDFMLDDSNRIQFTVDVDDWTIVTTEQTEYPEGKPAQQ